jgi:ectoine hydroxylase-related dioxygenase (phytanoyl-CoA dioxygenase family)
MSEHESSLVERLSEDGFAVVEAVFDAADCHQIVTDLEAALAVSNDEKTVLRRANGVIYGARNLLTIFPHATGLWRKQRLINVLTKVLGPRLGLVRGLYFDKPPESTWSLPWHQDLTIAVQDNALPSGQFRNRTTKAGVPHVEAPDELLRQMLTLRIHLDDVTEENGPLQVLPGTHVSRATPSKRAPVTIVAKMGDVLAMRPLLSHCSGVSAADTNRHRRVIHLEFSAVRELRDAYQWHQFFPLLDAAT